MFYPLNTLQLPFYSYYPAIEFMLRVTFVAKMSENNCSFVDEETDELVAAPEENSHSDHRLNDNEEEVNDNDASDQEAHGEQIENILEDSSGESDMHPDEEIENQYIDFNAYIENWDEFRNDVSEEDEDPEEYGEHEVFRPDEEEVVSFEDGVQRLHGLRHILQLSPDFLSEGYALMRRWISRTPPDRRVTYDESGSKDIPQNITFDKNLPTSHAYLGEMAECSGVAYRDQDTYQTLQIVYVRDFVLVPGQTVPMLFSRLDEVSMLRRIMKQSDKTFGVLMRNATVENSQTKKLYSYGCTAEIRSYQDGEKHEVNTLRIVILGRQKFQLIEKRVQLNGNVLAKVKILEDVELPELNNNVGMCVKCGMRSSNFRDESKTTKSISFAEAHKRKWAVTKHALSSTVWPPWLYRMYDVDYLRLQILKEMREWNQKLEERECPLEATAFSYWVIMNFPISDTWRLRLLQLSSAIERLRRELDLLQKCTILTCADCAQVIADRRDVFSMSVTGTMAAYVNPGGVVHDTLTLYKASGIFHVGKETTEYSWFPGYAWTVCDCQHCARHLGWKFTATKPDLTPATFWGLTRSALTPRVPEDQNNATGEHVDTMAYEPRSVPLLS